MNQSPRLHCPSLFQVHFLSSNSISFQLNPISFCSGFPTPIYPSVDRAAHETKVTQLSNGIRVASEPKFGQFCTVGVIIDSGSRYELSFRSGITHFLEKLSFNRTQRFESRDHILKDLEKHGGICDCQGSRDSIIYAASIDSRGLDTIVRILSEVSLRPQFTDSDLELIRQTIQFELEDIGMRPDQEPLITDLIHGAAFRSNTLGLPKLCPSDNVDRIDSKLLYNYLKLYHDPSRIVLAGVGIDHDKLVEQAQKYFVEEKPIWQTNESLVQGISVDQFDRSLAQYTGGLKQVEKDLSNLCPGPSPIPNLAHFSIGFEAASHRVLEDYVPTCVLNMMMGGGGSFSAGGPGKGMYTRLYTRVMTQHYWVHNATAYNHAYADGGLFCINASAHPSRLGDVAEIIGRECKEMAGSIDPVELSRAKTQLKSMLLMNLEARPVHFEDIARQVLANGHRKTPQFFLDAIERVTEDDIHRIVDRMLKSKISIAALGDTSKLPRLEDVERMMNSSFSNNRFRRFGFK
jgi:processing peptidase subunit alpha